MGKKIAINTLYTIGIFICVLTLIWGFQHKRYEILTGALLIGAVFVYLKINLLKEVKSTIRNKKPTTKP